MYYARLGTTLDLGNGSRQYVDIDVGSRMKNAVREHGNLSA